MIRILSILLFAYAISSYSQQISKEELVFLTPEWKGDRYLDGRPKVPVTLLERMKKVTLEEAWAVLKNENYKYQYAENLSLIHI